tara:strand:+ start:1110 stop:1721 length:612 start_codon:yes stop_codon:yes gene_type:complete
MMVIIAPSVQAKENEVRIAVIGDSYSAPVEMDVNKTWPEVLERQMNLNKKGKVYNITNFSRPNDTSSSALNQLSTVIRSKPKVAIVALGGTDIEHNLDPNITRNSLAQMLQLLRNHGIYVMLVSFQAPKSAPLSYTMRFVDTYIDMSEQYKAYFVEDLLKGLDTDWQNRQFDNPYPSEQGMAHIARRMALPLETMLRGAGYVR